MSEMEATGSSADSAEAGVGLEGFWAPVPASEAIDRLEALAKRGKLAGFERTSGASCTVAAHGTPFDGSLDVSGEEAEGGSRGELSHGLAMKWPVGYGVILLLVVWPGVVLTESFLVGFGWYNALAGMTGPVEPWFTWAWYIPMTLLPAPFMLRSAVRKSLASSREHAGEQAQKIRAALLGSG